MAWDSFSSFREGSYSSAVAQGTDVCRQGPGGRMNHTARGSKTDPDAKNQLLPGVRRLSIHELLQWDSLAKRWIPSGIDS